MKNEKVTAIFPQEGSITYVFLQNIRGYRKFLTRFFASSADIDDVLQDAYLKVHKAEGATRVRQPKSYIFKIIRNLALNEIANKRDRIVDYIEDFEKLNIMDDKENPENKEISCQELREFYKSVVMELPPQCRRVFIMRKAYGYSQKEIAGKLGISVSTVEKHLIKGMRKYRQYVQMREPDYRKDKTGNKPGESPVLSAGYENE